MSKQTSRDREVPANFSKGYRYDNLNVWRPTWRERFQLLLGFNVIVRNIINTEHKCGRLAIGCYPQTTEEDSSSLKKAPWLLKLVPIVPHPAQPKATAEELKAGVAEAAES